MTMHFPSVDFNYIFVNKYMEVFGRNASRDYGDSETLGKSLGKATSWGALEYMISLWKPYCPYGVRFSEELVFPKDQLDVRGA